MSWVEPEPEKRDENIKDKYKRHKWRVEAIHGEAKTQHGLRAYPNNT